jgi:hypothetical protein
MGRTAMFKFLLRFFLTALIAFNLFSCAGGKAFVPQEPQEGKSLVVGAVLIENNGVEDVYEAKTSKITVVVVGKSEENGKEVVKGYRVKTDENGYFALQNVPKGIYIIKGFEADLGFQTHMVVTSRWDGKRQIFYPKQGMIDYTVREWPEGEPGKVFDMRIKYFLVDRAGRVADKQFKRLKDKRGIIPNKVYNMPSPVEYYKSKYANWGWFK